MYLMIKKDQALHYKVFYLTIDGLYTARLDNREYKDALLHDGKAWIKLYCTELYGPWVVRDMIVDALELFRESITDSIQP